MELEIAVRLGREIAAAAATGKATLLIPYTSSAVAKVHLTGQVKYVRHSTTQNMQSPHKHACYNFGSELHLVKQFPQLFNVSHAAAWNIRRLRLQDTRNAVHIVLAHLCHKLDAPNEEPVDDYGNHDQDDAAIFDEKLVHEDQSYRDNINEAELENIELPSVHGHFKTIIDKFWGTCIASKCATYRHCA